MGDTRATARTFEWQMVDFWYGDIAWLIKAPEKVCRSEGVLIVAVQKTSCVQDVGTAWCCMLGQPPAAVGLTQRILISWNQPHLPPAE